MTVLMCLCYYWEQKTETMRTSNYSAKQQLMAVYYKALQLGLDLESPVVIFISVCLTHWRLQHESSARFGHFMNHAMPRLGL